jgi:hypothetical protein
MQERDLATIQSQPHQMAAESAGGESAARLLQACGVGSAIAENGAMSRG